MQYDHLHLLVEASDKRALSSGVRGISIRIARYVNALVGRKGRLWADRWFGRALVTPQEVRTALVYVLANFRKHARKRPPRGIDPFSSGAWFDGFRGFVPEDSRVPWAGRAPPPVSREEQVAARHRVWLVRSPRTRLAAFMWRRFGLIDLHEAPRSASMPSPSAATASSS